METLVLWSNILLLSAIVLGLLHHTEGAAKYCSPQYEFQCGNGKCIPKSWACDEDDDCGNNKDEEQCPQKTCKPEEFACADKRKCIPTRWTCDGEADCSDNSDEVQSMCSDKTCSPDQFHCGEGNCIPNAWRCDGQEDCPYGNDEKNCSSTTCDPTAEFTCKTPGKCITLRWRCDMDDDCGDNSDEQGCETSMSCKEDEFQCGDSGKNSTAGSSGRCIPDIWKCDGDVDCQDHSDEMNCPSRNITNRCSSTEWMCGNQECIHKAWHCDGEEDCIDKSDELNCSKTTCRPGLFLCAGENKCINSAFQCNGIHDCIDGSDELECSQGPVKCDNHTQFDCSGDGSNCISLSKVCDKVNDCGDSQDEIPRLCQAVDPCKLQNGGCMQKCHFTHSGHYCSCNPGFQLKTDQSNCEDINECNKMGTCSQVCENTKGGYKCSCSAGYVVDPKIPHFCKANGSEASLLFTNRLDMRELKLQSGHYTSLLDNLRAAIALDYDYERKRLFYSDVAKEEIRMVNLGETSNDHEDILLTKESISTPDGIAYDWIHQNLYWTDTGMNHIELFNIPNKHRKTLLASDLDEPRAIVVDPRENQGWIYWTDWGMKPRIEKAGLDGGHRSVIVDSNIQWPNGLTIDYVTNRIYWVDAKLHVIVSSDFEGRNRFVVLTSVVYLKHPFAITVFEDWLYWSDWETESINKVSKFPAVNGTQAVNSVAISLYSPMDVHVYHPLKQPSSPNFCSNDNGGCSHMCLPSPQFTSHSSRFRCACPNHTPAYMSLLRDNTDCVLEEELPTALPPHAGIPEHSTLAPHGVGSNHSLTGDGATKSVSAEAGVGRIAGVVVAIIGALVIVAAIVGFLVYRSLMKKNVKSMNFDNPVYRKTTVDDQIVLEKSQFQPSRTLPSTLEPLTAGGNEYV